LEIPPFDIALSLGEAASSSTTGNPAAQPSDTENPSAGDQTDSTSANPADEDENSPLSEYGLALNRALQQISGAGNTFGKTALMFQAGQATLEDLERDFDRFKLEVRPAMNEINQLSPPPEVAVSHQKITVGLEKCDEAINLFNEWLNSFDSSTQQRAALLVTQCLNEVQDGGEEIEARIG
jgi:hypothetical protein